MTHVRVKGFGAGDAEDDGAQRKNPERRIAKQEFDPMNRVGRSKYRRVLDDGDAAQY